MIERRDSSFRRARHLPHDAHIIQLAPQLARSLVHKVAAGNRRQRRQPRAKRSLPLPRPPRTARNRHMRHVAPADSRALQTIANRLARNPFDRPRARKFAFFHRCHNPGIAQQRRRRIVSHRGQSQNVHARCLHAKKSRNLEEPTEQHRKGTAARKSLQQNQPAPPQIAYARVRRDALSGRNDRLPVSSPRSPSKISFGWLRHTRHKIFHASSREYSLNDCFAGSFSRSTS